MDPEGNEDHVTTSRPQEVESNGQEDCWNISIACDFHKIYNNSQTMTTIYIYIWYTIYLRKHNYYLKH